jgi:hypothetical protein
MKSKDPNETKSQFTQRDIQARKGVYTFISADRIRGLQERVKATRIVTLLSTRAATLQIGTWRATGGLAVLGLVIIMLLIQFLK